MISTKHSRETISFYWFVNDKYFFHIIEKKLLLRKIILPPIKILEVNLMYAPTYTITG